MPGLKSPSRIRFRRRRGISRDHQNPAGSHRTGSSPHPGRYSLTSGPALRRGGGSKRRSQLAQREGAQGDGADEREGPEQSFLDEGRTFHVVPPYRSVRDRETQVGQRLRSIAAEDLAPWCKLGQTVFRASEVDDHGDHIYVTAKIKDDAVGRALEGTRSGDGWSSAKGLRFTWSGRSKQVDVDKVRVTSTSARSRTFGSFA
jgi:hypothetical protein